jgi:hypothetical protein
MAPVPRTTKFPQYAPDITNLTTGVSALVQNVVPRPDGYGPFKSLIAFTKSLPGPCRGYFYARRADGSILLYGATATDLYLMNNSDLTWTRVSKGGVSYASVSNGSNWQFTQFNDTVIAVQQNTAPQFYTIGSSAAFADLAGSPPQAGSATVIGFFLVLSELLSNPRRVQWSDLGSIVTWTAGVGLSDFQDMSDGGAVRTVTGSDAFGVIFQDATVRSMTYAPGSATVFNIVRLARDETLLTKYSVINIGTTIYYQSAQGYKRIDAGGAPVPIGKGRVDDTVKADFDRSNLRMMIGASDPTQTRVYWAYKSISGQAGLLDKILVYDPAIGDGGQFSIITGQTLEYIASLARPGLTLENMDAIAPTPINITAVANNGAGKVRLTVDSVDNGKFKIAGHNFIVIQGVAGFPSLNAAFLNTQYAIIDGTHLDITSVNFAAGYTGGGQIGGSLDQLTFSLDDISPAAAAELSAVDSTHSVGFFSGPNMEAIIEGDEEGDDGDNMVFIEGLKPITDCKTVYGSIGRRATAQQDTVSYTAERQVNSFGVCNLLCETRLARARLRFPFGAAWRYARAVMAYVEIAGED